MNLVRTAYTTPETRPTPLLIPFVHDWKKFFDPVLNPLQEHSGSHVYTFQRNADGEVVMFYKDYHSNIDSLRGGDGDGGLHIISGMPAGVPELVPRRPLPYKCAEIPDLFGMPGFPQEAQQQWRDLLEGQYPEVPVPADYFDSEKLRYQSAQHNYAVRLPPAGFEITQDGGYQSESSLVCLIYISIT